MLGEGSLVLIIGIGIVFMFFTVLVLTMKLLGLLVVFLNKRFPGSEPVARGRGAPAVQDADALTALAVAAAKRFLR